MKLRYKLALLSLVILLVLPMFILAPNGERIMTWDDWLPEKVDIKSVKKQAASLWNSSGEVIESKTGIDTTIDSGKIYKWRDQHGNWQFSNEKPPESAGEILVEDMPEIANVIQPVAVQQTETNGNKAGGFKLALPTTVPLGDIPKLIEDAKAVQKISDQRQQQISAQ